VITSTEIPTNSSSTNDSASPLWHGVKVVELPLLPAAERPFVGTHLGDSKEAENPGVRVELTVNHGMTTFAGSCAFVELHFERMLKDGSFADVCAPCHGHLHPGKVSPTLSQTCCLVLCTALLHVLQKVLPYMQQQLANSVLFFSFFFVLYPE
jgi:hypothetical protein